MENGFYQCSKCSTRSFAYVQWATRPTFPPILLIFMVIITIISLTSCASVSSFTPSSTKKPYRIAPLTHPTSVSLWEDNPATIWNKLQRTSSSKLADMQSKATDPIQNAWIQLAIMAKQKNTNTQQLASKLIAWREQHLSHPANALFPDNETLQQLQSLSTPEHIAILLPQSGTYATSGQTIREGFLNAYYADQANTSKQNIKFYDTAQTQNLSALYQQAIAEGADFVIGPLLKEHVQQISNKRIFPIPTLALNYTNNALSTNFYEFGLLPEDEVLQIANRAHEAHHVHAIVIAPQNSWGKRLAATFSAYWQSLGGAIQETWYYPSSAESFNQDIAHLLHIDLNTDKKLMREANNKSILEQQRRHDFDAIFLFAQAQEARVIVPLLRYYYANDIPVYATAAVYAGKPDPSKDVDLNGVIICDIPQNRHAVSEATTDRLYAVGQDAYRLSQSLQQLTYLPHFPIYGATGSLTLSSQHQIHRRLPCVTIHNGLT